MMHEAHWSLAVVLPLALLAALSAVIVSAADDREGLLLEYRFEGNLADSSGHGHEATAHGKPEYVAGQESQCLRFSGSGDYIDSGVNLAELRDQFTIECWVNPGEKQQPYADVWGNHAGSPFGGLALQQDGEQPNRYYFTYGTGQAWVYSHDLTLTPGKWQHVAVVKTPERLRVYLNGAVIDNQVARQPMAPSTTSFMVGLGIENCPRWFTGLIDEVRVWSRPLSFTSSLPEAEQVEQFVQTAQVEVTTTSPSRAGGRTRVALALDPEIVPRSLDAVTVSFECANYDGRACAFPGPVTLTRANDFRAQVIAPDAPGYFRVSYRAAVEVARRSRELRGGEFAFAVLADGKAGIATQPLQPASGRAARDEGSVAPGVMSLDGDWLIATDPDNDGQKQGWFSAPVAGAKPTHVPWIIQDAFPGYHGVAWCWREFTPPAKPQRDGRYLLRFWAVDYKADVWLNGVAVGTHEGGETPFTLDATRAVKPGRPNLLAVRVLNPTHQPIDGIVLNQTAHRDKFIPYFAGGTFNFGGLIDSVECLASPALRVDDLFVRPDPKTGLLRLDAVLRNAGRRSVRAVLRLLVAPAASGETLDASVLVGDLPPGDTRLQAQLRVPSPHLWALNDPYLYRVTARLSAQGSPAFDERSARCGFRDFRFDRGYFRLNGRRLFLRSSHTVNTTPVGIQLPPDPDFLRRDLLNVKAMGFNMVRFIWGGAARYQLDLCDEVGLLVYEESYGSWPIDDSPAMGRRFDQAVGDLIRRDRNHPSVAIWGLLNESSNCPAFDHAVAMLPLVRYLDDTRVVMLNSGRYDGRGEVGSLCNPGTVEWENLVGDQHRYPRVPHTADIVRDLRALNDGPRPLFLTEYGIGSAVDLWRTVRHYERIGKANAEDAVFYRQQLDRFLADWERWRLADTFGQPADFFAASLRKMAGQRTLGLNALRSNPNLVGYSLTGMIDQVSCGEGLTTTFRELKPGTVDALFDGWAPLRLCLFAEPANLYRGGAVRLEASLANEDALAPGDYPLRLQVFGPTSARVFDRTVTVTVPDPKTAGEPPFAQLVFAEDLPVDGPSGRYRFVAAFERGAAAAGGEAEFHLTDPADMPPVNAEVVLWGDDPGLAQWLASHGIRTRSFRAGEPLARELLLVSRSAPTPGGAEAFRDLARRLACGSAAVFLSPEVFAAGDQPLRWLPLAHKGSAPTIGGWLYLKDEWAKRHPIFDGLPAGGLMDYTVYREVIPDVVLSGQDPPAEAVAGAIKASQDYASGLLVSVHGLGAGRFILNTLRLRENLGPSPVAERLLRNMLRYAARDLDQPPTPPPPDLDAQLDALGYGAAP